MIQNSRITVSNQTVLERSTRRIVSRRACAAVSRPAAATPRGFASAVVVTSAHLGHARNVEGRTQTADRGDVTRVRGERRRRRPLLTGGNRRRRPLGCPTPRSAWTGRALAKRSDSLV